MLARRRVLVALGALGLVLAPVPAARADPGAPADAPKRASKGAAALATGLAIAGASLAYGGTLLTSGSSLNVKHDGLYVMDTGLTLAPLLAHGVGGEWARGSLFAIAPALSGVGMAALLSSVPEAPVRGRKHSQRIYPVLITASFVGSAVGIVDAALVDWRIPSVALTAGDGYVGAELAGRF